MARKLFGLAPVEDEVAVGKVVHDRRAGGLRVGDRLLEGPVRRGDGSRVGRVVEVDGGDVLGGSLREVGRPAVPRIERDVGDVSPGERRPGRVVRVVRVGQHDRLPLLGEREAELDDRGLRPRDNRDLGVRIERHAVLEPVPVGEGRPQLGQAAKR